MADSTDGNGILDLGGAAPKAPVNLRIAEWPYPHLRDDSGCILARDYVNPGVMAFVLAAVAEKLEREASKA